MKLVELCVLKEELEIIIIVAVHKSFMEMHLKMNGVIRKLPIFPCQ